MYKTAGSNLGRSSAKSYKRITDFSYCFDMIISLYSGRKQLCSSLIFAVTITRFSLNIFVNKKSLGFRIFSRARI